MLVFGHRGAAGHEPENTLRSIRKALELGVDGVEIDVRSVDGRLIVFHDDVLDRTTNGRGPIRHVSFETLRGLDAGRGEYIPLLTEVLELIDARVGLNIEVKERGLARDIAGTVADCFEKQPAWRGRVMLSSFDREETAALAEIDGGCLLGILFKEDDSLALERARRLGAYSLHASMKQLDCELVDAAHASGIKVFAYTVNETSDIEMCHGLGVDGLFSDFPDRALVSNAV
jgi:glycerophosphoryl diester phosphodiesterase